MTQLLQLAAFINLFQGLVHIVHFTLFWMKYGYVVFTYRPRVVCVVESIRFEIVNSSSCPRHVISVNYEIVEIEHKYEILEENLAITLLLLARSSTVLFPTVNSSRFQSSVPFPI